MATKEKHETRIKVPINDRHFKYKKDMQNETKLSMEIERKKGKSF